MNIFEQIGFKLVNDKFVITEEDAESILLSISSSKKNGKTVVFTLSSGLIEKLNWQSVDRISVLSNSISRLGITTPYENETTYKLIKISDVTSKRLIKFTWKLDFFKEPEFFKNLSIDFKIVNDGNERYGLDINLPNQIFKEVK